MQYFILPTAVAPQMCTREGGGTAWVKAGGRALQGALPYAHSARVASIYAQPADPSFMLLQKVLNLASSATSSPWAVKKHFCRPWGMQHGGERGSGKDVLSSIAHPCSKKYNLALRFISTLPLDTMQPKEAHSLFGFGFSQLYYTPIPKKSFLM